MESENEEYLLSLLYQHQREQLEQERDEQEEIEQVRLQLEKEAWKVLTRYQQSCEEAKPKAQADLREIVMPWWQGLSRSRFLHELSSFIGKRRLLFSFSTTIEHWWPYYSLLGSWSQEKPLSYTARFISEYKQSQQSGKIENQIQNMLHEQWRGYFCVAPDISFSDLMLYRLPTRVSCGFNARNYALAVDTEGNFLSRANPMVIIEFGRQIQDGTVVRVIEKGIKDSNDFNGRLEDA